MTRRNEEERNQNIYQWVLYVLSYYHGSLTNHYIRYVSESQQERIGRHKIRDRKRREREKIHKKRQEKQKANRKNGSNIPVIKLHAYGLNAPIKR